MGGGFYLYAEAIYVPTSLSGSVFLPALFFLFFCITTCHISLRLDYLWGEVL